MEFGKVRSYAEKLGADRNVIYQWKFRERIPLEWQVKIVRSSNGDLSFDDFPKIDWRFEKGGK